MVCWTLFQGLYLQAQKWFLSQLDEGSTAINPFVQTEKLKHREGE